MVVQSSVLRRT